jgi:hypothetical protein
VRDSALITAVSCPGKQGCVAVGVPSADRAAAVLLKIGDTGRPAGSHVVGVPPGTFFTAVTCSSVVNCTLAGLDLATNKIEIGLWNGRKLTVRQIPLPAGTTHDPGPDMGVSCWGPSCVVVGTTQKGPTIAGLILPIHRGTVGHLIKAPGDALSSVSCISSSRCYVAGTSRGHGLVLTLKNAVPSSPRHTELALYGIACTGMTCTAAGVLQAPPPAPFGTTWGSLVSISAGKVTATRAVSASSGYTSVARTGRSFMAVGRTQTGSLVTTG